MSDETLEDLDLKVDLIARLLNDDDIEDAEVAFSKLAQDIKVYFGDANKLKENRLENYQAFYNKFIDLILQTDKQKKNLAESISKRVNSQKKINVYKSIK